MTKKEFREAFQALEAKKVNLEGAELDAVVREQNALTAKFAAETAEMQREDKRISTNAVLREAAKATIKDGQRREITLSVIDSGDTNNIVSSGAIELNIQQMLPTLEKGLIYNLVGLRTMTGVAGDLLWPYASNSGFADEPDETEAITPTDINFGKKTATAYRVGAQTAVTYEAIDDAAFDLAGFVTADLSRRIQRTLNKKTFGTVNFSGLKGPFANASASQIEATWKNIKEKKAAIAATGVDMSTFAYVMDNKTKALLETTPKANGQGGFVLENGKIDGDPVFVTEFVNIKSDGSYETTKHYIEMGCWGELAACQHGQVRLTIDPYTAAGKNEVIFTLNTRYSLTNLATDAAEWAIYDLTAPSGVTEVLITNDGDSPVPVLIGNGDDAPVPTKDVTPGS